MRGSRGGVGGVRTPPTFAKLNIADITGNEKICFFVMGFFLTLGWPPPPPIGKIFWIRACTGPGTLTQANHCM